MSYSFATRLGDFSATQSKSSALCPLCGSLYTYNPPESASLYPPVSPFGKPAPAKGNGSSTNPYPNLFVPPPADNSWPSASTCPPVSPFGNAAATLPAAKANGSSTRPYLFGLPSADNSSPSALRKADGNAKPRDGHKTDDPEGQRGTELLPYHQEAHEEATQYLRTLYLEIEKNPTVALYNYNKYNAPSPAVREAMDKIDEINGRLLRINCSSGLSIAVGQIMRDRFVRTWKLFIYASEKRKGRHRSALAEICKELHYPSAWANVPPGDFEEPY